MKHLIAIIAMALASTTASAQFYSGNQLLEKLKSDKQFTNGVALGYVVGVADMWDDIVFCLPNGVTAGQLEKITVRYFEANPQLLHESADVIVGAAFGTSFPCKKSGV